MVERHRRTGRIGLGYVHGFGLTHGAIASTVAHDAHNCMVVGALDESGPADMAVAVARLAEIGGGQVAVRDGRVLAEVRLPIGGLMSDRSAPEVAGEVRGLAEAASQGLGVTIDAPFMQLSFLGLSVLPELRITDKGLVDVMKFALTDVAAGLTGPTADREQSLGAVAARSRSGAVPVVSPDDGRRAGELGRGLRRPRAVPGRAASGRAGPTSWSRSTSPTGALRPSSACAGSGS